MVLNFFTTTYSLIFFEHIWNVIKIQLSENLL